MLARFLFAIIGIVFCFGEAQAEKSELGIKSLRGVEDRALAMQRKFEVDAAIRLTNIRCMPLATGHMCVGSYVKGIVFNSLTSGNKLLKLQLVISRGSVENPRDIGRALNAFAISSPGVSTQQAVDLFAAAGAACVLSSKSDVISNGSLTLEQTGTGCVIGFNFD